jgi:hypothetical protein
MKKRISIVSALALATALTFAAAAQATTLGTTTQPTDSSPSGCGTSGVINQLTSAPSTPYEVPGTGTITQWQTDTGSGPDTPGFPVKFVVLRRTSPLAYSVVAVNARTIPSPLPAGNVATFSLSTPIAVQAGDTLGLYTNSNVGAVCYWNGGATPLGDSLAELDTVSAPTSGQALAITDASGGAYTMNLAATFVPASTPTPTPTPTPASKKKCKKHKKHKRSASSAKKKCKKKKKR